MSQAVSSASLTSESDGDRPPTPTVRIDSLRERVAAPELAAARQAYKAGGLAGVAALGRDAVERAEATRSRFEMLTRDLERHPGERLALIEAYLRETVQHARALKDDLRALRRGGSGVLDVSALAERASRAVADAERAAEAALAFLRKAFEQRPTREVDVASIAPLARTPGRWSRRTEALAVLAAIGRTSATPEAAASIRECAHALADRREQRWVQPAALSALASVDAPAALTIALERLRAPLGGDDFLVRERIVELAGRGMLGPTAWPAIFALAADDPSEHVRITYARSERDIGRLAGTATSDASAKVRATALITLTARDAAAAESALIARVEADPAGLVVQTAAEELATLARRGRTREAHRVMGALSRAAARTELPALARTRVAEARLEVVVFGDVMMRAAHDSLAPIVADTPVGGHAKIHDGVLADLDDTQLGCVLAVLSRDDYALGIDRIPGGVVLHRGEARGTTTWRLLHELAHPSPSKRQAFPHAWGRIPGGALRAPPGGLAELNATRVPGERVLVDRAGGWGRHLPLVDDLLSTGVARQRTVTLVTPEGTTTIDPPGGFFPRLRAWARISTGYAKLAGLRHRSLDSEEPATQAAFVNEVARTTGIAVRFEPHAFAATATDSPLVVPPRGLAARTVTAMQGGMVHSESLPDSKPQSGPHSGPVMFSAAAPLVLAEAVKASAPSLRSMSERLGGLEETWHELVRYAGSPHGNRLPHLAAYVTVMLGAMIARGVFIRRSIEHDRDAIPLVIGGWGTRGKSGTERLKAALFQGLGHEVLVKTTGCEAMFIHAVPDTVAREVFIYRPYDKATVWEQRDVLGLARRLNVRVFLYECMALQPDLVNLLQSQWMRDDYSTITNAYPDHEDVQGPSGYDVANVISEFVPTRGNLITAEEQMLPLLRERAKERDTNLRVVGARDAALIADDLLARFPYDEHPKNVALVTALARTLGIPAAIAIAEMADNVVPDLGVLKRYADVPHAGRTLSFVNGMSANERTGAISNWKRAGLEAHDPEATPGEWIVTLVNNRADRVARSEVFAQHLVEDVAAHRHVLIGTNVGGLLGFVREALNRHLLAISPTRDLEGDGTARLHTARSRLDAAFRRLKIGATTADSARKELAALGVELDLDAIEAALTPAEPGERYEACRAAVDAALPKDVAAPNRPHAIGALARRRAARAVHALLSRDLGTAPLAIDRAFAAAYKAIFEESVIALHDPALTGDQLLDTIAAQVPVGVRATIVGLQNIKGTGLDFVYRWVSIDTVHRQLVALGSPRTEVRDQALRTLLSHGDYGLLDARLALEKVEAAAATDPDADTLPYEPVLTRLRELVTVREKRLRIRRSKTLGERVRGFIGTTFDYLDATRRRRMAGELLSSLVLGRVSHATAARRMREIVARAKGNWALSKA